MKEISRVLFDFLKQELDFYRNSDIITQTQEENILRLYEVKKKTSFVSIILVIGSILIGLGILSFIASNWVEMGKSLKLIIILFSFIGVNFVSFKLTQNYPKTSKSLIYLGVLIFGSGIFLIGQMFNFGGHFTTAFLLWAVGILPMSVLFRDKAIFAFSNVLTLVYINGYFNLEDKIPIAIFLIIPALYYLNKYFDYSKLITFFANLIVINTILFFAVKSELESAYTCLLIFAVGVIMYFIPISLNKNIFEIQGTLLLGITGLLLTIPRVWYSLFRDFNETGTMVVDGGRLVSIVFAVIFVIFLISLTRRENIIALLFICMTILKFYFDTAYNFMPKSLFFIIGGISLLGFGYFIERTRKKWGGIYDEE